MSDDRDYLYFKATKELQNRRSEMEADNVLASEAADALAKEVGGKSAVFSLGQMVAVHFEDARGKAPTGWKRVEGSARYDDYFRPLVTKGLRDIADRMRKIKRSNWRDILELVDLSGHMVIGDHVRGGGFQMIYSSGEEIGDELIVKVPISKKPDDSVIGKPEYSGHELLIPITKADYLQMLVDSEREKEKAA